MACLVFLQAAEGNCEEGTAMFKQYVLFICYGLSLHRLCKYSTQATANLLHLAPLGGCMRSWSGAGESGDRSTVNMNVYLVVSQCTLFDTSNSHDSVLGTPCLHAYT